MQVNISKSAVLFFWIIILSESIIAQPEDTTQVYEKHEITFNSEKTYDNYITDIRLRVTFTGPNGAEITQDAFWDGGATFKVRFAPAVQGLWSYTTSSSDLENQGLNNVSGEFFVEKYTGEDPVKKHGWLRVSDNGRYLSYRDGTPFFYLGDTAWEISWKSTREELSNYINDRAEKEFTAIQFVPQSHQKLYEYGVENRAGETYFIDENYSKLNPRYFDYVDDIVDSINAKGMVAVIVPLWAAMNELHHDERWKDHFLTNEESMLIPRYMGARYAADNVIWIVGGDNVYETEEQLKFWHDFANILKEASGERQLATVHTAGWNASFNFFDNNTSWLDFHMYQSSHRARAEYTIIAATEGYSKEPVKPVLNGEAVYEDIFHRLWAPGDTTEVGTFRIRPEHVRQAGYESILSGAIVGYTYGGNGIWQWHKEGLAGTHFPRFEVMEAIEFLGSSNMTVLRDIMEEYEWYHFEPKPEYVIERKSRNKITTSATKNHLVSYFATGTIEVSYQLPLNRKAVSGKFINPSTGAEEPANNTEFGRSFTIHPPDTMDWVFVAELEETDFETPVKVTLYQNFPNPFNPYTIIHYYLDEPGQVTLKVYNSAGRLVQVLVESKKSEGFHTAPFNAKSISTGIYFYRINVDGASQIKKMVFVK